MKQEINRRQFIRLTAAGGALCLAGFGCQGTMLTSAKNGPKLVSPGCRRSKVKVARIFMGKAGNDYWPKPSLDLKKEVAFYKSEFAKLKDELSDVEFVVDELVGSPAEVAPLKSRLEDVDGILVVHLTMRTGGVIQEILKSQKPTMVFAVPYTGHQWVGFGSLQKQEL